MGLHRDLLQIAAPQCFVVSRAQVLAAGYSATRLDRLLDNGDLEILAPGVYGIAAVPPSFYRRLWVAHLAAGPASVVSHEAAAHLHGFVGFPPGLVVLTVPHPFHARVAEAVVHQSTDLAPEHVALHVGLPVTTPARTLADLAGLTTRRLRRVGRGRVERALDDAIAAGTTTVAEVGRLLTSIARRGKPGVSFLACLLDDRGPGYVPPQSELERGLHELVTIAGLPPLERQAVLPGWSGAPACVDGRWSDARMIVEADGRRWHTRVADLARDHERDSTAAAEGWLVVRLLYEHIVGDPTGTAARLHQIRAVRLRQLRLGAA